MCFSDRRTEKEGQIWVVLQIWGTHHTQDNHYLRVFIGRLRSKLGDDPTAPRYIETEAGVGYRFIAA